MGKVIYLSKRKKELTEAFIEKEVKKLPITELSSVLFCPECNTQMTEILAWGDDYYPIFNHDGIEVIPMVYDCNGCGEISLFVISKADFTEMIEE